MFVLVPGAEVLFVGERRLDRRDLWLASADPLSQALHQLPVLVVAVGLELVTSGVDDRLLARAGERDVAAFGGGVL